MTEPQPLIYPKCNPEEFPELFTTHMNAMTVEKLESKSAIAIQLAHRDYQIKTLLEAMAIISGMLNHYHANQFAKGDKNVT